MTVDPGDRGTAPGEPRVTTCAIVVTYAPDQSTLDKLIAVVSSQVDEIVVVDNGPEPVGASSVTVLSQPVNLGLAAGHNRGIAYAREHGFSHVLLLDQDSIPDASMVRRLHQALTELAPRHPAAVGPVFRDEREGRDAPFVRIAFPMSKKLWCTDGAPIECDFLISSGSLIPLAVLDDVGDMDAGLFIDHVDMEWSFRARSRGYRLFGVCRASMAHSLGDSRVPILGGRYDVVAHNPVRLYFIMRNRVALYRLAHTPRVWIAQDLPRVLAKFVLFSVFVGPRPKNVRYMLRGLRDGVRRRLGPCSLETT